ncbi:SDR family oxidoreductase [Streptococcus oricebi]|uniref:NAD-dependent dehydratase n=1 Tax=Streptococcus oricebi TaxID=1547447 RepID=A0ABS5B2Z6_9STRE|nr:SDR family oxidoreductase [Streptococcus oricebi]MBP2623199.1 NAD-dependent dehydratase [Streptococcus oricebi]
MKIFIAGASGRVAQELISILLERGHDIYAGARSPEKLPSLLGLTAVKLDLKNGVSDLSQLLLGMDALYFTAGSRGRDLLQTDAFGAVKLMQAAQKAGVQRFIMLSSLFALEPEKWQNQALANLQDYYIAKFFADNYLLHQTDLDYTILQPGTLLEKPATGKVDFQPEKFAGNAIADVAQVLAGLLDKKASIGQVIKMIEGELAIDQALDTL